MNDQFRLDTLLVVQGALLGEVTPNMKAVAVKTEIVSLKERSIYLRFYFDTEITEDDLENASCIETIVISNAYPTVVSTECIYSAPFESIDPWGDLVFLKSGIGINSISNSMDRLILFGSQRVNFRKYVCLILQYSLLGAITPNMQIIEVKINEESESSAAIRFYLYSQITENDLKYIKLFERKISAFPSIRASYDWIYSSPSEKDTYWGKAVFFRA